jgi:hypothetical protein
MALAIPKSSSDLIAGTDLDIGRLDVAVNYGSLAALNVGREGMQAVELVTDFARIASGAGWVEALLGFDDLRDASPFDVLHGDEEAAVAFTVVVDFEGSGIDSCSCFWI